MKEFTLTISLFFLLAGLNLIGQVSDTISFTSDDDILSSLKKQFKLSEYDEPDQIMRFSSDTVVVAGSLSSLSEEKPRYDVPKNVIYKTTDRGKNWREIKFNGNTWVWHSDYLRDGKIWMGGSDKILRYSNDFGETWTNMECPFPKPRKEGIGYLFMIDSALGLCAGWGGNIAFTKDNWKTKTQIETPLKRGKYKITKNSARSRIQKIALIDSIIIIDQNSYIYYSKIDKIEWKEFNIPLLKFKTSSNKKEIHLYSINDSIYVISSDLELIRTIPQPPPLFTFSSTEEIHSIDSDIDFNDFISKEIDFIKIKSSEWIEDGMMGLAMKYKEETETTEFVQKDSFFILKSESKNNNLNGKTFTLRDLNESINRETLTTSLSEISFTNLFNKDDFNDFQVYLNKSQMEWDERKEWGGNSSCLIPISHQRYNDYHDIIKKLTPTNSKKIFFCPFNFYIGRESPKIEIIIMNKSGDSLTISNENSCYFSLPWEISLNGIKRKTFNSKISHFLRLNLPKTFKNYELLFGGELIYQIVREKIKSEIKYKKKQLLTMYI